MRVKTVIVSFLLFFHCLAGQGQSIFVVSFQYYEDSTKRNDFFSIESLKVDSLQLEKVVNQRMNNLYELGYLATTSRLIYHSERKVDVLFYTHHVFKMVNLSQGNVSDEIMNKVGFDSKNFNNRPFSHHRVVRLLNSILDYAENHGYPFSSIKLDSISITGSEVGAWLNYQSGPMIVFDSLLIAGYDKVKTNYLMTHLGIYKGKPYEEKLISEISNKIKLLSFVSLTENPEITISNGKCTINLNLAQNKVSLLDGILGVLPNQKNGESLLITGQLNLDLKNLFSSGKRLALEWQSYDANSQLLDVLYFHPNLFRTPINIQGDFYLLKQDTTFINRDLALELSLLSKNSNQLGFRTELIASRLISTSGLENSTELPDNTDYNLNYYGINYRLNRFNDINFPTQGWGILLNGSVGQKKIIKNPILSEDIYNSIELNTIQFKLVGEFEKFWSIYKNILFRTKISGGYLNGDNLFQSDLFRVGGLRSIRGFGENQFYTSGFGIANMEFRAMFSHETYFMIFFDQAAITDDFDPESDVQYPFGTGAGFSFSTNAGIFNFVFAMGKSNDQPFGINYSKIHFGYISRF